MPPPANQMGSNDTLAGEQQKASSSTGTPLAAANTSMTAQHNIPIAIHTDHTGYTLAANPSRTPNPTYIDLTLPIETGHLPPSEQTRSANPTNIQTGQATGRSNPLGGAPWGPRQGPPVLLKTPVECDIEPGHQETTAARVERTYGMKQNKACAFNRAAWAQRDWFKRHYQALPAGQMFECRNLVWQEEGLCNDCVSSSIVREIGRVGLGPEDVPESRLAYTEQEKAAWQWENGGQKWGWMPSGVYR